MPDATIAIGHDPAAEPVWLVWSDPFRCYEEVVGCRLAHRLGISVPPWRVFRVNGTVWFGSQTIPGSHHATTADVPDGFDNRADIPLIMLADLLTERVPPDMRRLRIADRRLWLVTNTNLGVIEGRTMRGPGFSCGFSPAEMGFAAAGNWTGLWTSSEPPPVLVATIPLVQAIGAEEFRSWLADDIPPEWARPAWALEQAHAALLDRQAHLPKLLTCSWQAWQQQMLASAGRAAT